MEYNTIKELVNLAESNNCQISEIVIRGEMEEEDLERSQVVKKMRENLKVMKKAAESGVEEAPESESGLSGGDARQLKENPLLDFTNLEEKNSEVYDLYHMAAVKAVAVAEVNASMGKIVAGPTAGSSGIVPGVLLSLGQNLHKKDEELTKALFTAAGLGTIVAQKTALSGAAGGCQAECGVASGMAAAAAVELLGGEPSEVAQGFALALKNLLGLVCDPVAGLVEVPCVKRNGFAASHALTATNMALAGIESVIPPDEVIEAMTSIGEMMPSSLKETALGGLAATTTGLKIKNNLSKIIDN